jgi:hypothetical protein
MSKGILNRLNIVKGKNNLAGGIFEDLFPDFFSVDYNKPNEYILKYWNAYLEVRDHWLKND